MGPGSGADAPPDPHATELTCTLVGHAARWTSPDGSFAIWTARRELSPAEAQYVTVKGEGLGQVGAGELLSCHGRWREHPKHGWAFECEGYTSAPAKTAQGVATWLARNVDGVGRTFAEAVVAHFGAAQVFDALDADAGRLREVRTKSGRKLPERQLKKAIPGWSKVKAIREVETFLFSHGVSPGLAARLHREYGAEVVAILTSDPYRISELRGVGFVMADTIARSVGIPVDHPARLQAGLVWVLDEAERDGHVFLLRQQLVDRAVEALRLHDSAGVAARADALSAAGRIVVEEEPGSAQRVYSKRLWEMESRLGRAIRVLLEPLDKALFRSPKRPPLPAAAGADDLAALRLPSDAQWGLLERVRGGRLTILSGGPGVGKSQAISTLVEAAEGAKRRVGLCAPTGRAARRMNELTDHPATTIHRLLEFSPREERFQRDENNVLDKDYDLLVVDEASMLSLDLADALFRAAGSCHVLLVGDTDQLPPVGAGNVLADLIDTGVVPQVHLTHIFRQAASSLIVQNARRINTGELPWPRQADAEAALGQPMLRDFFWVPRRDPAQTAALAVDFMTTRIPREFGLDPVRDIVMLAPMRRGVCGLEALNGELERRLNPGPGGESKPGITRNGIAVGSRVIQNVNSYADGREIMNGELALVLQHSEEEDECLLVLDDGARELWVPVAEMESFTLAWAISVHKSQGSQAKAIVCVISMEHRTMLSRPLTYTAVTRAQQLCVAVGEPEALERAVKVSRRSRRNSTLARRVLEPGPS